MGHIDLAAPVSPHLVLQGRAEPHRLPARHRAEGAREGPLLRGARSAPGRRREARGATSPSWRARSSRERALEARPRGEARARRGAPPAPPRVLRRRRRTKGFDEDDEYWARMLNKWAEEKGIRARRRPQPGRRPAARGGRDRGEDAKKVRELMHKPAVRDDRRLGPQGPRDVAASPATRSHPLGASSTPSRAARAPRRAGPNASTAPWRTSAATTPRSGRREVEDRFAPATQPGQGAREARRALGNGLLADVVRECAEHRPRRTTTSRLANDLCLRGDGKMSRDDARRSRPGR